MGCGFHGFAQIIRGAINGLLVIAFYRLAPTLVLRFGRTMRRPALRLSTATHDPALQISAKAISPVEYRPLT